MSLGPSFILAGEQMGNTECLTPNGIHPTKIISKSEQSSEGLNQPHFQDDQKM